MSESRLRKIVRVLVYISLGFTILLFALYVYSVELNSEDSTRLVDQAWDFWSILYSNPIILGMLATAVATILFGAFTSLSQRIFDIQKEYSKLKDEVHSKISSEIKQVSDSQMKSVDQRIDGLNSKIEALYKDYPWLDDFSNFDFVIHVDTARAVFENACSLLESGRKGIAYEMLSNASKSKTLVGSQSEFRWLAALVDVVFHDSVISSSFYSKSIGNRLAGQIGPAYSMIVGGTTAKKVSDSILMVRLYNSAFPPVFSRVPFFNVILPRRRTSVPDAEYVLAVLLLSDDFSFGFSKISLSRRILQYLLEDDNAEMRLRVAAIVVHHFPGHAATTPLANELISSVDIQRIPDYFVFNYLKTLEQIVKRSSATPQATTRTAMLNAKVKSSPFGRVQAILDIDRREIGDEMVESETDKNDAAPRKSKEKFGKLPRKNMPVRGARSDSRGSRRKK